MSLTRFKRCHSNHFVFHPVTPTGGVILAVYMDDIFLTRSDCVGIEKIKEYLRKNFSIKELGNPCIFLVLNFCMERMEWSCLEGNMHSICLRKLGWMDVSECLH